MDETFAANVVFCISEALIAIHSLNIIHRDIKLGNIFLSHQNQIKLGDFGLATTFNYHPVSGYYEKKKTLCGTPNYIAPEILKREGYSLEVDAWSLGVVLYTILIGDSPFLPKQVPRNSSDLCKQILEGDVFFPSSISDEAKDLIAKLLAKDPAQRIDLKCVKHHSFVSRFIKPQKKLIFAADSVPSVHDKENHPNLKFSSSLGHEEKKSNFAPKSHRSTLIDRILENLQCYLDGSLEKVAPACSFYTKHTIPCFVTEIYDLSKKYGFFYRLSDNSTGAFFNDHSALIRKPLINEIKHYYLCKSLTEKGNALESSVFLNSCVPLWLMKKHQLLELFYKKHFSEAPQLSNCNTEYSKPAAISDEGSEYFEAVLKIVPILNGHILRLRNRVLQVIVYSAIGVIFYLFVDELRWLTVIRNEIFEFNDEFRNFKVSEEHASNLKAIFRNLIGDISKSS